MSDQARREVILEVADRLLRHYGPQKTTMADVAREANVGVGSVYLDFPSKDALIEELSRRHYRRVLAAMRSAAEEAAARPASDRLVRVFEARATGFLAMRENGAHACDLLHCGSDAVKAAQGAYQEEEKGIFVEVLRAGKTSGELAIGDLDATLRVLLLAYAAFAPPWIWKSEQAKVSLDLSAMHGLILNGLLRREGAAARNGNGNGNGNGDGNGSGRAGATRARSAATASARRRRS